VLIEARIVEADTNFTKSLGVRIGSHDHQGMNAGHKIGGQNGLRFGLAGSSRDAYAHLPEFGRYPATAIVTDVDATTGEITYTREVPTPVLGDSQLVNLPISNPAGQLALTLMNSAKTQLLTLELSALEADGKGKTISSPRIMTMDQMEATIQQGIRVPYLVSSASGATSIAWQDANLSLKVKPHITPDGRVMMKLKITKNALGPQISLSWVTRSRPRKSTPTCWLITAARSSLAESTSRKSPIAPLASRSSATFPMWASCSRLVRRRITASSCSS
jgi:type IV pilus assembly protein PilQ